MDEKTLHLLEFPRVLERLAGYASFHVSSELARALAPTSRLEKALERQRRTGEARLLLSSNPDLHIGGVHDIRSAVNLAAREGVLEPLELIKTRDTLVAAREFGRMLERNSDLAPLLAMHCPSLVPPPGIVDSISRAISDEGEVVDQASETLAGIRRELRTSHDRLLARLERIINDPQQAPMLQETIITQRNGRYVIPLRAEFKGRIRSIIHDQSSSGATLFIEPLAVVDLNNRWHELQLAERDEIRRILAGLSAAVGASEAQIQATLTSLAELDLAMMCARYAEDIRASEPLLSEPVPKGTSPGITLRLYKARHPLLAPESVVPINVELDEDTFAVVITGPNTGGKTVTLKTIGLLAAMAQAGMHIPAQSGSAMSIFVDIFADIGDEQSIEQSLSTFSGHITNIVRILGKAGPDCLVLLDELGAGTDPQEGAALARALLQHLVERKIPSLVATHYPELKAFAHSTPGVVNASMEFNLQTLKPTYHLTIGLPGRSNALLIAERLGLPASILRGAREQINPSDLRSEDLLDEIHRQRDKARLARSAAETARQEAQTVQRELSRRLEKIEEERDRILQSARSQAEDEVETLRAEIEEIQRALQKAKQPLDEVKALRKKAGELEVQTSEPERINRASLPGEARPLKPGEKVRIRSLNMEGIVHTVNENEVEVQAGALRIRAGLEEVRRPADPEPPLPAGRGKVGRPPAAAESQPLLRVFHPSPGMELDLRGQRAEDALETLGNYLDAASLAGLPMVRIIHGKGTGRLRQVIRDALRRSPNVSSWETGGDSEGGEGVTVARLASLEN